MAIENGFDFRELNKFEKDLLEAAQNIKNGKYVKKFLRKEGTKLNKENKKQAKASKINKKTGNFMKGFKRGKPYKYRGTGDFAIRAYNNAPHAHLLNNGHRIVDKNNNERGFKKGEYFMEKAEKEFKGEFYDDCRKFIDEMLENHEL
ncbi:HK97 gp10 family phage protein [Caminicella sporogenes]|uniref:HK97 gp10 family phage protein n=1 Tax=Caminicella sporogenes TaxID=166485 RepID=UPI002541187D|nr:HK97 gp10 family phage protein [Caminicella sporogenes]WIF95125.1 HK97 gp10 family phage protein [Caminicella sporogenes]